MMTTKINSIAQLYKSKLTVFSNEDLVLLWGIDNRDYLKAKIYRLVKSGQLLRLRSGIFTLDKNYNRLELCNKLVVPSYISFETVLTREAVTFQYDSRIYAAADQSRQIKIEGQQFVYRQIKESVLYNNLGIISDGTTSRAGKERAIVDMLYLAPGFYYDKLDNVDWDLCFEIAKIYNNKALILRLKKLKGEYAQPR